MPTAPTNRQGRMIRERLLLYGPPKCGKTRQYLLIAKWHQAMGSDAKFYAVSSDLSYEVMLMGDEFGELDNVEYVDAVEFQDYIDGVRKFHKIARPHDWLSVDLQSSAWVAVQNEAAEALSKKESGKRVEDLGDLWKTAKEGEYPIKGWDWGMPNGRYQSMVRYILTFPGHTMCMEGQKELLGESGSGKTAENPQIKDMFGHVGLKPNGQKGAPFDVHTVIHVAGGKSIGQNMVRTAGDRHPGRRWWGIKMSNGQVRGEPMEDFFMDYLVKTGGWEV